MLLTPFSNNAIHIPPDKNHDNHDHPPHKRINNAPPVPPTAPQHPGLHRHAQQAICCNQFLSPLQPVDTRPRHLVWGLSAIAFLQFTGDGRLGEVLLFVRSPKYRAWKYGMRAYEFM